MAGFEEVEAAVVCFPVTTKRHRLASFVRGKQQKSKIRTSGGCSRVCGSNRGGVVLGGDGRVGGGARGLLGGGVSSG